MTSLLSHIDALCNPNPDVFQTSCEREIVLRRNKAILFTQLACLACTILYILLTNRTPSAVQIGFLLMVILIIFIFLVCCRSFQNIFTILYFALVSLFGPVMNYCYKESVFFNSIGVALLPTWVLCLSGKKTLFFIQLAIQNVYLHILYKPQMIHVLNSMPQEAYFQRVCNITTFSILINAIFVFTTELAVEKGHFNRIEAENRKLQLDHQRIFLLSFSHEIKNLINSVIGNVRLCLDQSLSFKVESLLRNSEVCGEVLLHLVNNILDTGKVQIGELEIHPSSTITSELWGKTWGICSQLIKQRKLNGEIRIQTLIPDNLKIDNHRLMQIFLNLVGNSIKFTEKGSITIDIQWIEDQDQVTNKCFHPHPFSDDDLDEGLYEKVKAFSIFDPNLIVMGLDSHATTRGYLHKDKYQNKGILKIIVSDTGCGIAPENLSKLFNKFSQVHEEASMRRLGTGLGLFITKELVHKMDGEIKAFSKVGKGSAFIVCIPAEPGNNK